MDGFGENRKRLTVREVDVHEAGELARDGPVDTVPGDARSGVSEVSAGAGWRPLVAVSQPTPR